ncbi:hypothetical protein [Dokdonella immobilis]|nr:hypothetical protein [Dokdonella immobilis]
MSEFMKKYLVGLSGAVALCVALVNPQPANAADFQVALKRLAVTQCSMTGSLLNIDPVTGNVSIDLSADIACYPTVVNAIANNASISITGPTTVGGGQTGSGTVNLQLNTGLSGPTSGVTCTADGVIANSVTVSGSGSGSWGTGSPVLCTNCGPTATASVSVQNPSTTVTGSITFKAKCNYQDQGNANLQIVRTNIISTPAVQVLPGQAPPPPDYCESVAELATPNGLTDAMRQSSGTVTGGTTPGTNIDFLNYTSVFGVRPNVYPPGTIDTAGYGFPGTNPTNVQFGLKRNFYISWKFRTPTASSYSEQGGAFQFIPGPAFTLASIAPCPGQFSTDANYPMVGFCQISGKGSDLPWKITTGTTTACKLEPGKTYYLNVIQATGVGTLTTPTCPSTLCSPKVNLIGTFPN